MGFFFAKGAASASYSSEVLADSPVAYYRLDETSGSTAADSSGNALDGTYVNSPTLNQTGGLTGNAAVLFARASSQRVNLGTPSALNVTGQFTIECLYKPTSFPTGADEHMIVSHGYAGGALGYILSIQGNGGSPRLAAGSYGAASYGTGWTITGWSTGQWKHIAAGYDGTNWKLFLDGVEVGSTGAAFGALSSAQNSYIGAYADGAVKNHGDGVIDEVALYAAWLGSTRIAAHVTAVA